VYEDETTIAFLDANPLAPGHTLVIPKDEYERLNDVPEDIATDLYATIHRMVPAVEEAVDADATTVAFNNGEESGQEVPHVHCHIVPGSRATAAAPFTPCSVARPISRTTNSTTSPTRSSLEPETVCCTDVPEQPQDGSRLLRN